MGVLAHEPRTSLFRDQLTARRLREDRTHRVSQIGRARNRLLTAEQVLELDGGKFAAKNDCDTRFQPFRRLELAADLGRRHRIIDPQTGLAQRLHGRERMPALRFIRDHDERIERACCAQMSGQAGIGGARRSDQIREDDIAHGEAGRGKIDRPVRYQRAEPVITPAASDCPAVLPKREKLEDGASVVREAADDAGIDPHEFPQSARLDVCLTMRQNSIRRHGSIR